MKMGGMTDGEGKVAHGDMMAKGGMMGEGKMMCPMGRYLLPQLPEGNEQLQLQMQAEILRSIAEISSKYANMVAEEKGS